MSLGGFNWLDVVLALVIVASMVSAVRRGFSREIIGLAAVIVGLICGIWFYGPAGALVESLVASRAVANFFGFIFVFFGILLAGSVVSWLVNRVLKMAGLSWFDRMLGAVFGFARGALVAVAIVMAITAFAPGAKGAAPQSVVESRLAPYAIEAALVLTAVAPRELKDEFARHYEQVKKIWRDAVDKGVRELPRSQG